MWEVTLNIMGIELNMQVGTVYMTSFEDLDNPVMGVTLRRMWWKPWRYSVQPMYYQSKSNPAGYMARVTDGERIDNLTKLGVVGYMKLFGVKHKDFEEE